MPLGLPLPVRTHHDHRHVGRGGGGTARSNSSPVSGGAAADAGPQDGRGGRPWPHVHRQLVRATGLEVDRRPRPAGSPPRRSRRLARARSCRRRRRRRCAAPARPALSSPSRHRPDTSGVKSPRGRTEHAPGVEAGLRRPDPQDARRVGHLRRHRAHRPSSGAVEVLDGNCSPRAAAGRSAAGHGRCGTPPRSGSSRPEALGQRVGHAAAPVRRHLRAAAAHGELAGVRADDGHARDAAGASGSSPSLTSRTVPSAATSRATARRPGSSSSRSVGDAAAPRKPDPVHQPQHVADLPSTTVSSTSPSRTAAARVGPNQAEGPGISRSRPARAAGPSSGSRTSPT